MGTQLCPRTVQQHRAAGGGKVGEYGGPYGDAVRAEIGAANVAQAVTSAAADGGRVGYYGGPYGDAVMAESAAATVAQRAAAAAEKRKTQVMVKAAVLMGTQF